MADFYKLARAFLFTLDAERAHHLTLASMRWADRCGLLERLVGGPVTARPVEVMGLNFPNRVGLAAGMDKSAIAIDAFGALGFGHVEVGTVTPRAQPGNEKPRLFRIREHQAIINRMGFNNPGLDRVIENARTRRRFRGILGFNLGKNFDTPNEQALNDYLTGFRKVRPHADYVVVNLSSPNTKGLRDLQNVETCRTLVEALQVERERGGEEGSRHLPIAVKIAPDLTNDHLEELAAMFSEIGVDAVIATNTTIERAALGDHPLASEAGGLSGAPVRDRSTEVIGRLRSALDPAVPIIGVGGIFSARDAQEKLEAGAALVQIYTGLIYRGPALVREIADLAKSGQEATGQEAT